MKIVRLKYETKDFSKKSDQYCGQKTSAFPLEDTSIAVSERQHSHWRISVLWPVNVNIPTGGYQCCGQ
ncbi:hypothetical protein Avbf_08425 [Armadillidium vulgare]|nr:hypothetical protein Avbf_08425 [Armadillidium vulgare]